MKLKEKKSIINECAAMTDEELILFYNDLVFSSLGSQSEDMYDLGYDISDILERISYEKYLIEKCDIVEDLLHDRGLEPWKYWK